MSDLLRVATFNIRCGNANDGPDRWELRRPRTTAFLRKLRPDLLGLQEALDFQIKDLREDFPHYKSLGVGREDGISAGEHAAIFYDPARLESLDSGTFWFSETPDVPGSMHWGNRITRICTWARFKILDTGREFWHFNLHIDHESEVSRERSAALLVDRFAQLPEGSRLIVTGDFNEHEDKPAPRRLRQAGLLDSFRLANPDATDVGTFCGFHDAFDPDKIDYIFIDPGIEVVEANIVRERQEGGWPSDHAAVTATLRIS